MADRAARAIAETIRIPLVGAGGEPVDFIAALNAHGLAHLPPNDIARDALTATLDLGDTVRTVRVSEGTPGALHVSVRGTGRLSASARRRLVRDVRTIFALDDDLAPLYARVASDAELAWIGKGAGRLLRSPTAFEDVIRTICTTNCAWSATERMIGALVAQLGAPSAEGTRAFPSARAVAAADVSFFRDVARAGYRGAYMRAIAERVVDGSLDLEALRSAPRSVVPDAEIERQLLALPGVGPYAAAHILMLFGRCSIPVLDSWTRPTYARMVGRKTADRTIRRRFARYGEHAGLAFWMFLWRDRLWGADKGAP